MDAMCDKSLNRSAGMVRWRRELEPLGSRFSSQVLHWDHYKKQ